MISQAAKGRRGGGGVIVPCVRAALLAVLVAFGSLAANRPNVLDRLSNEISDVKVPAAQTALRTAASRLRAATSKGQALSAIAQCRSAIASAISLARTIGRGGSSGLDAIAGVLSHAAALIQSKG